MVSRTGRYRGDKPPGKGADRRDVTPARAWQVVAGLFLLFTGIIAILWLFGADFESEYRRRSLVTTSALLGGEAQGTRLSACGVARTLLPSIGGAVRCAWWNIGSFYILPLIAFGYAVKAKTLGGVRDS